MATLTQAISAQIRRNDAVLTQAEFMRGWRLCQWMQPLTYCANDQQRRGWWAYLDAEAGATYSIDAVQRGVPEDEQHEPYRPVVLDAADLMPV